MTVMVSELAFATKSVCPSPLSCRSDGCKPVGSCAVSTPADEVHEREPATGSNTSAIDNHWRAGRGRGEISRDGETPTPIRDIRRVTIRGKHDIQRRDAHSICRVIVPFDKLTTANLLAMERQT